MISTQDLERIAAGGHCDSTQAPQIARELIAAREVCASAGVTYAHINRKHNEECPICKTYSIALEAGLDLYYAAREAE